MRRWVILAGVVGCIAVAGMALSRRAPTPPALPDLSLTPGAVDPHCTVADICPHLSFRRPPVSAALRTQVYDRYGLRPYCIQKLQSGTSVCEVDHLISVELCGATTIENLWPESYLITNGAHTKDQIENRLHKLVCAGDLSLEEAQKEEAADWISAYRRYIR
jgi:hypothetical protein